jgi:TRAP-type mannitol/chloroaromatic compound transport system substrate-binding protein
MQRGVINAFEYGGAAEAWDMGFHEVIDYTYISLSRAPSDGGVWLANQESWNALPNDLKNIVMFIQQGEIDAYWVEQILRNGIGLQNIAGYGVTVQPLPKPIEDAFIDTANGFFDDKIAEFGADSFYARVVTSMREFKAIAEAQGVF